MNSFGARANLRVGSREYEIYRIDALDKGGLSTKHLPYSMRILLENLLRNENGRSVTAEDIKFLAQWKAEEEPSREISYSPARVLMQDFTGVPAVVDLAAMRDAVAKFGGDPAVINPLQPAELVIDHSVQVDEFGSKNAFSANGILEFERNRERYAFLRWGQNAFRNFAVVPPEMGICHQINLEYLARVIFTAPANGSVQAYPDTLVGTDSHTTMINGLGVLGWGVGGIEAEAAMLGQPVSMLLPQVVGFKLTGRLKEGSTATDLVLTITEILRKVGVVGKFVEYFGPGLRDLPLADRATIGNMSPEYGATCGIFPVDATTLRYLRMTGRSEEQIALVEAYCKEQGLFHNESTQDATYSRVVELDLSTVEPSVAGPKRPQDRVSLSMAGKSFHEALPSLMGPASKQLASRTITDERQRMRMDAEGGIVAGMEDRSSPAAQATTNGHGKLDHGSVVIAAITSCTNTSNPSVMLAAGLMAKKAVERGINVKPWVKTSLSPGSRVVTQYYKKAGLQDYLDQIKFHTVGYGCMTCIGNSGPLPENISHEIDEEGLVVCSVLSGNRNFEGRINSEVRANYLMSPPLVVAYALAGRIDHDFEKDPLGIGKDGKPVYLRDIWPSQEEVDRTISQAVDSEMFHKNYASVFAGDERWQKLPTPAGKTYTWDDKSTYIKRAPYFDDMEAQPAEVTEIRGARILAILGDSVTTDHISPAGAIKKTSPAGLYLQEHGVSVAEFNSYGSRRGNHEVMVRGTFANIRLRNKMVPGSEGGVTKHVPTGEVMSIYDASVRYANDSTPLVVIAGKEYGSGSSRDWAAKGPLLLGVRAVIAQSYERIHRSNLVGMGILPVQFHAGENAESLGLTGEETLEITGICRVLEKKLAAGREVQIKATAQNGTVKEFAAIVRIDTPQEILYYQHGGILHYVLRQLLAGKTKPEVVSKGGMATMADPASGSSLT
jgi:aconitate hydratase